MRSAPLSVVAIIALIGPATAAEPGGVDSVGDPLPAGAIARFGTTRLWSPSPVNRLEFSSDGKYFLGMQQEGSAVWVWLTATGKLVGMSEQVAMNATFAPDGKVVLVGVEPCCRLWDPTTGKSSTLWHEQDQKATMAAFSPDGHTLAVSLAGGQIALVDPTTGKKRNQIKLPGEMGVSVLTFSHDSRSLAIGMQAGHVWLWDCVRNKRQRWYQTGTLEDAVTAVAFSPDGRTLAVSAQSGEKFPVKLFESDSEGEVEGFAPPNEPLRALRFSTDGKSIVGASLNGRIMAWEATSGKELRAVGIQQQEPMDGVAIDPGGGTLLTAKAGRLALLDGRTGKPRIAAKHFPPLQGIGLRGKDGDTVVLADAAGGVHFWETGATGPAKTTTLTGGMPEIPLILSPDGSRALLWGEEFKTFKVHDTANGKDLWTGTGEMAMGGGGWALFSPDGKSLVHAAPGSSAFEFWDATGKKRRVMNLDNSINNTIAAAWSADGRSFAIVEADKGPIYVWEIATGQVRQRLTSSGGAAICFFADGRRLAVAINGGGLQILRLGVEEPGLEMGPHVQLDCLEASPDGRWLAAGAQDGRVFLIEPGGNGRHELRGHQQAVTALRFVRNTSRLVSCSADGTALVWDLKALPKPAVKQPSAEMTLEQCWTALASNDAAAAHRAKFALETQSKEAVAMLKERLLSATPRDNKQIARWVEELNSTNFPTRQKAAKALEEAAEQAEGPLRTALESASALDHRRRIEELLEKLDGPVTRPELLRAIRAVEVLESIGTPEARTVVEALTKGDAGARLTREAKATLERMRGKH